MRKSNSRERTNNPLIPLSGTGYSAQHQQQQATTSSKPLSKTSTHVPASTTTTNPKSNKRIESSKSINSLGKAPQQTISACTKPLPKQDRNLDIQNNMTQSKIFTAKESLLLVKKRMSRNGGCNTANRNSRDKPSPASTQNISEKGSGGQSLHSTGKYSHQSSKQINQQQWQQEQQGIGGNDHHHQYDTGHNAMKKRKPTLTKVVSKHSSQSSQSYNNNNNDFYDEDQQEQFDRLNQPQKRTPPTPPIQQKSSSISSTNNHSNSVKQKPSMQLQRQNNTGKMNNNLSSGNPYEQAPIVSKPQNFDAILQRELRKQAQGGSGGLGLGLGNNSSPNDEYDNMQMAECRAGCGRMFNVNVLPKHQKVCEKVFQSKRKVFNTAEQRRLQGQAGKIQQQALRADKMNKKSGYQVKPSMSKKVPKWKLQSAQFRMAMNSISGKPPSKEQEEIVAIAQNDDQIQCGFCGRKFNKTAGQRHIKFCQTKAKQMPKMNTGKRK